MGFEINPYDFCVANAIIDGSQCTIAWHVDNNKVSHINEEVISKLIKELETYFGKFKVTRGKMHNYLGMIIKIREDKNVSINQTKQLEEIIEIFSEPIIVKVTSIA